MAGTAVVAGDDDAGGDDDVAGDDDVEGGVVGVGGNAAAAVGLNEALLSGRWVADKKAKAAVHSTAAPMTATGSHFLADLALAGVAVTCGFAIVRPSSHVTTR